MVQRLGLAGERHLGRNCAAEMNLTELARGVVVVRRCRDASALVLSNTRARAKNPRLRSEQRPEKRRVPGERGTQSLVPDD